VFITGGSSGIGLGIARACAAEGMKVAISYRSEQHLRQAKPHFEDAEDRFCAVQLDVRDRAELEGAAAEIEAKFGPVNLLVNNAGVGFPGSVLESTPDQWEYALSVNLLGVVNSVQTFVPRMTAHGGPAHVVATASMSGLFAAGKAGVYTTSKFAVVGIMEALANELFGQGIGVSICCPGIVQSNIADWKRNSPYHQEEPKPPDNSIASTGMDPLEYGKLVLNGVRKKALYILTHPEYTEGLAQRCEALQMNLSDVDCPVPPQRLAAARRILKSPIYEQEIHRLTEGSL
jgi:NAD(P)-dependent dehydrogenase (short-subunit alcohol dehydrogenase family)